MEAGSSVLVDKSLYPRRNNSSVPGFHDTFLFGPASQRFHGVGAQTLPYAPYALPGPTYSSLPTPSLLQHPSPPLLPLPISKSFSLPSPIPLPSSTRAPPAASAAHSANKDQRKSRPSPPNPKKDPHPQHRATRPQKVPPAANPLARVPKHPAAAAATSPAKDEKSEEEEGGGFTDDVYALSPPPSSLPMPKFSLRPRTPSAPPSVSCNTGAFRGNGALLARADAGASDDLRRLLRL